MRGNVRKLLESTGEDTAHRIGGFFLRRGCDVGVGVQRKSRAVVSQHPGDCLDVHAVLQGQRSERMPLWHNKDKLENPCGATG